MRMWMLAAGAAALAISAPALADPKGGQGGGKGQSAQVERGGGKAKAQADRGRGGDRQVRAAKAQRGDDRGPDRVRSARADRGDDRRDARVIKADNRGKDRRDEVRIAGDDDRGRLRVRDLDDDDILFRRAFDREIFPGRGRGLVLGCPPGLDKRDNGCMPPGHVKNLIGAPLARTAFANSLLPQTYRAWFRDDDDYFYRAANGFIYRVDRDDGLIDGLIPISGMGYYAMGEPWPSPYNFYNVPYQYRSIWADDDDYLYRFSNGAIYAIDPDTMLVNGIVSLLAGDLGVGSRLPMGYDVYNVPLAYRSTYYDTPDAWYRYNDGYIYRVDPTTRLITAVIDALV